MRSMRISTVVAVALESLVNSMHCNYMVSTPNNVPVIVILVKSSVPFVDVGLAFVDRF
jgi:hypothetical protein